MDEACHTVRAQNEIMNTDFKKPPPIIHSAKTLYYAVNDESVEFTDRINLFVGEVENFKKLGEMPLLAICENYSEEKDTVLFFCDSNWEPQGVFGTKSVEQAKSKAEIGYKGITNKWISANTSEEELNKHLKDHGIDPDADWWKVSCTFCGKSQSEVEDGLLSNEKATTYICYDCIKDFYKFINED